MKRLKQGILVTTCTILGVLGISTDKLYANDNIKHKLSIYESLVQTSQQYENEWEEVKEKNTLVSKIVEVNEGNNTFEFLLKNLYQGSENENEEIVEFKSANDKENEILEFGFLFSESIDSEYLDLDMYITNDKNYVEINTLSYSLDTENMLYNFVEWVTQGEMEFLTEDEKETLDYLKDINYNYDFFMDYYDSYDFWDELYSIDNELDTEGIEKVLFDAINQMDVKTSSDVLFIDGEDREVKVYESEVDLTKILTDISEYLPDYQKEEVESIIEEEEFKNLKIKLYEYNGYIVKYGLNMDGLTTKWKAGNWVKVYENVNLSFAHNSTSDMLKYVEFEILTENTDGVKIVFENDLLNEEYTYMSATIMDALDEVDYFVGKIELNIDHTKDEDNFVLSTFEPIFELGYGDISHEQYEDMGYMYSEYYDSYYYISRDDLISTLGIEDDGLTYIYKQNYYESTLGSRGGVILSTYKKIDEILLPTKAKDLLKLNVEDVMLSLEKEFLQY